MRAEYATRPRELIAGVLGHERRFFTATEIHRTLADTGARVSLSTVYRTLEHLQRKAEVTTRLDGEGEAAYMLCEPLQHHHHAICSACGRVEDVDCTAVEEIAGALLQRNGFAIDGHAMEFVGRCRACR